MKLSCISEKTLYRKIYFILLCLLAISLPFPMLLNNILIIVITAVWLTGGNFAVRFKRLNEYKIYLLFLSLFLLLFWGLAFTHNMNEASFRIEKSLPLLLLPLVILTSETLNHDQLIFLLKCFIGACFASMIYCIGMAVYKNSLINYGFELNFFTIELTFPMDIAHVYYGMYLAFANFGMAYIYIHRKRQYNIILVALPLIFSLMFMLAITAKMALIALVLISLLIVALTINFKKDFFKVLAAGIVLLAIILISFKYVKHVKNRFVEGFHYSFSSIENTDKNYSSTRMAPLKCALELIQEHWLTGVGTGDTEDAMTSCYNRNDLGKLTHYNSHNQYLGFWITFGILGVLILLACFFSPLYLTFRKHQYLYMSFLLLFIICNLSENILERNKGIVFYAFFNSILAQQLLSKKNE